MLKHPIFSKQLRVFLLDNFSQVTIMLLKSVLFNMKRKWNAVEKSMKCELA